MLKRWALVLVVSLNAFQAFSQDETTTPKEKVKFTKPDIPGSILIEFGFNLKTGLTPPTWQKSLWGSRTLNIYYQYPIRIGKTKFSLNPGVGLSLERWKFSNDYALAYTPLADGSYPLVQAKTLVSGGVNRSFLVNNYIDFPIELRFDTHPEDMARSLNISFGARFGVLYDSFSKIDYTEGGEDKTLKDKQFHGMRRTRFGIYGRAGIGGFSVFSYFNLSPMFDDGKGPNQTLMTSATIGISVNGF